MGTVIDTVHVQLKNVYFGAMHYMHYLRKHYIPNVRCHFPVYFCSLSILPNEMP